MIIVAAFAGGLSLVIGWFVAVRLFKLARRAGAEPERILAIGFGGTFGVGYPLCAASRAPGLGETYEGALLFAIGMLGIATGLCAFSFFPQIVFRPGRAWASALSLAAMTLGVSACVGSVIVVTSASTRGESIAAIEPWALTLLASIAISMSWNAIESAIYYRNLKRRLALGLADAATTHRFLLWSIASGSSVFQIAAIASIRASGLPILDVVPMTIIAVGSLATSFFWWLAFFMPKRYRAHLERRVSRHPAV